MAATLDDLEGWLSKITENTRLTYETVIATRPVPQVAGSGGGSFGTSPSFAADLDAARKGGSGNPRYGGGPSGGGSPGAGMSSLENWLIKITENTRLTHEALSGRTLASGGGAGGGAGGGRDWPQRLDDLIAKVGKRMEGVAGTGIGWGQGQVQSLRQRGMGGTLESARLDYAMEQLGRQVGAIFMPLTQAAGYAATKLELAFRGLSGDGQNRMFGMLAGGALGMRMGGVPGAMVGSGIGAMMMGDGTMSTEARAATIGGSAWLGYRTAGPWGAGVSAATAAVGTSGDYSMLRRQRADGSGRSSMVVAGMASVGMGVSDLFQSAIYSGETPNDRRRREFNERNPLPGAAAAAARRDVTPFQADMGEAGSSYFRMQAAMIRTTAGPDFEDAGPLKPIIDGMLEIIKLLAKIAGVELNFDAPPPSAEGARA